MMNTNTYKLSDNELENVNGGGFLDDLIEIARDAINKRFKKAKEEQKPEEAELIGQSVETTICYLA